MTRVCIGRITELTLTSTHEGNNGYMELGSNTNYNIFLIVY